MKKIILLSMGLSLAAFLTGCEMAKGIAKDIENTGNNLYEALDTVKYEK